MKPAPFAYTHCTAVPEALSLLIGGAVRPCGGTQSLGPMLNLRLAQPDALVDVSGIAAMQTVTLEDERLVIGAAVTHARIEDDADGLFGRETQGLLPHVAAGIAYRAVRHRGTLGGSLAHADPAADWLNTAYLLDAGVRLGRGGRLPAGQFVLGPFATALDESDLIVAVDWPRLPPGTRWSYRKACRKPGEFAKALVAAWQPPQGPLRLLLGALNVAPHVVQGDAQALRQRAVQTQLFDDLGLDDLYQRQLLASLLKRVYADLDIA